MNILKEYLPTCSVKTWHSTWDYKMESSSVLQKLEKDMYSAYKKFTRKSSTYKTNK